MIKKILFGLLIFLGVGLSFSSAGFVFRQNGNYGYSTLDNSIDLNVVSKGQLMSDRLGITRPIIALSSTVNSSDVNYRIYFFWSNNNIPYYFVSYGGFYFQGFLKSYKVCDEIFSTTSNGLFIDDLNCTNHLISDTFSSDLTSFFNSITNSDYWGYDGALSTCRSLNDSFHSSVCFSSSQYHRSVCFSVERTNGYNCTCYDCDTLSGSLHILSGTDFTEISYNYLGNPPGFQINSGGNTSDSIGIGSHVTGSIENNNQNTVITGSYVYDSSCTYNEIVDYFTIEGDWSKYFCYGGLDNFDLYDSSVNYSPVPGSGKTLNQILTYSSVWDTPNERYNFWNGLYKDNTNNYNAIWESYPAVYHTWFDLYYQYGGGWQNFNDVLEFCNIVLNYDTLSGSIYKGHNQNFINSCKNLKNPVNVGSGMVAVGVNRDGIGGRSGNKTYSDGSLFIQDIFNTLKYNFNTNYGNTIGILPSYIFISLLAILLFKFLRK